MNKEDILQALKKLKSSSKKRKFDQSIDVIINLQNINLKNPEENVNTFVVLSKGRGKTSRVAALVGKEIGEKAKVCDEVVYFEDFKKYQDKKLSKKLAKNIDFFVAQANLMPQIAMNFGKVLGPMGKMPNPKAGCIVPPGIPDLKPIVEKLKKTVKLQNKNELIVKAGVGKENMSEDDLVINILDVYNAVLNALPQNKDNIRNVMLKLTMSKPVLVGKDEDK